MSSLFAPVAIAGMLSVAAFQANGAVDLFVNGNDGYNTFRIPSLYTTANGTVLAFCEGRVSSSSDTGNINVVLRRSFDGGVTWQPLQQVWSEGNNTCGNPTVVQDQSNGRIWLFMTWNDGRDTIDEIQAGTSYDVRHIYSCYSDDDGATWSAPVDRFAEVQNADTRWDATGPGCGIQIVNGLHPGRLSIPANRRNIYSDDHGVTWAQSTWLPSGSSEAQVVEIAGGMLLRNDRAVSTQPLKRALCRSTDQGTTWGPLEFRTDLVDPHCQGSTITAPHQNGLNGRMLVFANAASTTRDHMTIQCSLDDGATWPFSTLIYSGYSAYSALSQTDPNWIGLLYERDNAKITFIRSGISALAPATPTATWASTTSIGWTSGSSWAGGVAPASSNTNDVFFYQTGTTKFDNNLGTGDRTIRSLNYNANADTSFTNYLSSANSIGGGTARTLTFDSAIGSAAIAVNGGAAGSFTIGAGNGAITLASSVVVAHEGSGTLTIARPMGGTQGLTLTGGGTLLLSGTNTYGGQTEIQFGTLVAANNSALGTGGHSTATMTHIYTGATLALRGGISLNEHFHVWGAGMDGLGAVRSLSGDNALTDTFGGIGGYALRADSTIGVDTNSLTVTGFYDGDTGTYDLTKVGAGTLILSGASSFTGNMTVSAGVLNLRNSNAVGTTAKTVTCREALSEIQLQGNITIPAAVSFATSGTSTGDGFLPLRNVSGNNTINGDLILRNGDNGSIFASDSGTLTLAGGISANTTGRTLEFTGAGNFTVSGAIADGATTTGLPVTKSGSGTLILSGVNSFTGDVAVNAGVLNLRNSSALGTTAKTVNCREALSEIQLQGNISIPAAISFATSGTSTGDGLLPLRNVSGNNTINGALILRSGDNGSIYASDSGTLTLAGDISANTTGRTLEFTGAGNFSVSGAISDGATTTGLPVTKSGTGTLTLSGANTYTGATAISTGTLLVNGAIGNSAVTVKSGATLGGMGTIGGTVNVQSGGTLSPGTSIGTMTINNGLTLAGTTFVEVNASNGQRDLIQGLTSITYGGSLVVSNLSGTLTNGQTFPLFSTSGTMTGNFTNITPVLTGGKAWSFNPTSGVLSVVATTASYPTNISFSFSGGMLCLTWPASHLGWFAQSNAVSLASPGNWFDIAGSSASTSLNIIPSLERSNVFYRLRSP